MNKIVPRNYGVNYTLVGASSEEMTFTDVAEMATAKPTAVAPTGQSASLNDLPAGQPMTTDSRGALKVMLGSVSRSTADKTRGVTACYSSGTRISTQRGDVPVEQIRIGDQLKTVSGSQHTVRRVLSYKYTLEEARKNPRVWPICLKKGALSDGIPRRDLLVSPDNAVLYDKWLIPAYLLVNEISIIKIEPSGALHYYGPELESRDVVFAEGAPAESCGNDQRRARYQEVSDSTTLYPNGTTGAEDAPRCAPRLDSGVALERIRRELRGRAGRLLVDGRALPSSLTGRLDELCPTRISGWAYRTDNPERPVLLSIFSNGAEIGRVRADRSREDLVAANVGNGRCAFELSIPAGLNPTIAHQVEVWSECGQSLLATPAVLEPMVAARIPSSRAHEVPEAPLGELRGRLDGATSRRIWGWAQDGADAERPVGLLVMINGKVVSEVLSNRFRMDLMEAGIGSGRHSFSLVVGDDSLDNIEFEVRVLRACDGSELQGSPLHVPAKLVSASNSEAQLLNFLQGYVGKDLLRALAKPPARRVSVMHEPTGPRRGGGNRPTSP